MALGAVSWRLVEGSALCCSWTQPQPARASRCLVRPVLTELARDAVWSQPNDRTSQSTTRSMESTLASSWSLPLPGRDWMFPQFAHFPIFPCPTLSQTRRHLKVSGATVGSLFTPTSNDQTPEPRSANPKTTFISPRPLPTDFSRRTNTIPSSSTVRNSPQLPSLTLRAAQKIGVNAQSSSPAAPESPLLEFAIPAASYHELHILLNSNPGPETFYRKPKRTA